MKIGYRTIKTAVGIVAAILIAEWLELENAASAGILAALCIQSTKQQSLHASWTRLLASVIALVYATLLFESIAYHPVVIGGVVLLLIPTTVTLRIQEGIVSSIVLILHVYLAGNVTIPFFFNEVAIVFIGVVVALVLNSYMPSVETELVKMQQRLEALFEHIFEELIFYLRTNELRWDGAELTEARQLLKQAKSVSLKEVQNHFTRYNSSYYRYFMMREQQLGIIERLLSLLAVLSYQSRQADMIADFLEELKQHIHPGNTALIHLSHLNDLKKEFEEMPLPTTREEFETRASLLQFVREMERYLQIKARFAGMKKSATATGRAFVSHKHGNTKHNG